MPTTPKTWVLKFGGSSLAAPERILRVAHIVAAQKRRCERLVVVVSAMGDTTDELIDLALRVSEGARHPRHRREMDMLLSSGERISMSLLSMALQDLGLAAVSFTGSQSGILTDTVHGEARISEIRPSRIEESLAQGKVVIVAGFQGVSREKEVTTLGRGGSDTSAVALGVALSAEKVLIYTDVDGFYSADPRLVPSAQRIAVMPWDLSIEAANRGAQVLHPRSVEVAWKWGLPLRVLSSFQDPGQDWDPELSGSKVEGVSLLKESIEGPRVLSVAVQKNLIRVQKQVATASEAAAQIEALGRAGVRIRQWEQTNGLLNLIITDDQLIQVEQQLRPEMKLDKLTRLSLIGVALGAASEVPATWTRLAHEHGLEVVMQSQSHTTLDMCVRGEGRLEDFVRRTHEAFVSKTEGL